MSYLLKSRARAVRSSGSNMSSDSGATAPGRAGSKRSNADPIDLTGSDEESPPRKRPRLSAAQSELVDGREVFDLITPSPPHKASPAAHAAPKSSAEPSTTVKTSNSPGIPPPITPAKGPTRRSTSQTSSGTRIKASPRSVTRSRARIQQPSETDHGHPPLEPMYDSELYNSDRAGKQGPSPNNSQEPSPETPFEPPTTEQSNAHQNLSSKKSNDTIGTDSPIYTRIKERRSKRTRNDAQTDDIVRESPGKGDPPRKVSTRSDSVEEAPKEIPVLEKALKGFDKAIRDDHALSTRLILEQARKGAENAPTVAVDKVSPFASLKSIQYQAGDEIAEGCAKEKMDCYAVNRNGKLSKSTNMLVGKMHHHDTPRVPKYSSHINVRRNILSADDEKLKFIPFLKEADGTQKNHTDFKRLIKDLEEAYKGRRFESSRDVERSCTIRSYLPVWLDKLGGVLNQQLLEHFIISQDVDNEELQLKSKERKMILEFFGGDLSTEAKEAASEFRKAFDNVFPICLADTLLPPDRLKEIVAKAAKSLPGPSPKAINPALERLSTYTGLLCLICGAIDCPTHGDFTQERVVQGDDSDGEETERRPAEHTYQTVPLILPYPDMIRKHDIRMANKPALDSEHRSTDSVACSRDCYMLSPNSKRSYKFDKKLVVAFPEILRSFGGGSHRSCHVAFNLAIPCWIVHIEINKFLANKTADEPPESPSSARSKKPDWYDNKRKVLKGDWMDMTTAHLHQERSQANPCTHPGPCDSKCDCFTQNILCESYCGCPDDCPRKFTGCACLSLGVTCTSDSCICIQMNRECGPECGSCGAIDRINPANKYDDELFSTGCQNVYLQRGVSKALIMGESQLEGVGFGLYAAESIKRGDFLSEYAGEVISSAEAERRGIIYDRKYLSFLFDLNGDWVIDAARLGNKTRFINHAESAAYGLNCEAKIVLVNGEHRIKFIALRDIEVGEELLFNYGKKFAEKHGLSKTLPKAKEGGKKGVLEGEALDALDGMTGQKKGARGKLNAIRGKARGRAGNKMRKTAPVREPVEEKEQSADVQEDEDDDENAERRKRRKITRPARYTK